MYDLPYPFMLLLHDGVFTINGKELLCHVTVKDSALVPAGYHLEPFGNPKGDTGCSNWGQMFNLLVNDETGESVSELNEMTHQLGLLPINYWDDEGLDLLVAKSNDTTQAQLKRPKDSTPQSMCGHSLLSLDGKYIYAGHYFWIDEDGAPQEYL